MGEILFLIRVKVWYRVRFGRGSGVLAGVKVRVRVWTLNQDLKVVKLISRDRALASDLVKAKNYVLRSRENTCLSKLF